MDGCLMGACIVMSIFPSGKVVTAFNFLRFVSPFFACVGNDRSAQHAERSLTTIVFKVRTNNFSKYLLLPAYEKNFVEFSFL